MPFLEILNRNRHTQGLPGGAVGWTPRLQSCAQLWGAWFHPQPGRNPHSGTDLSCLTRCSPQQCVSSSACSAPCSISVETLSPPTPLAYTPVLVHKKKKKEIGILQILRSSNKATWMTWVNLCFLQLFYHVIILIQGTSSDMLSKFKKYWTSANTTEQFHKLHESRNCVPSTD